MKRSSSWLLTSLFIVALIFSCSQESPKPKPSIHQILRNAAKARTQTLPDQAIAGSWRVLATHDADGTSNYTGNNACYANVIWNLGWPATNSSTWQVLNHSGSGCGWASNCDAQYLPFADYIVNSGYSNSKFYFSYNLGDGVNRIYFEETSECNTKRTLLATWTIWDEQYLVIYVNGGQDIILIRA